MDAEDIADKAGLERLRQLEVHGEIVYTGTPQQVENAIKQMMKGANVPTDTETAELAFNKSLAFVLHADQMALIKARKNYGESWCKRGGVGAWMMACRKIDRIEKTLESGKVQTADGQATFDKWDILKAAEYDERPEGIIDDIRDLRRYLTLIEAKLVERGIVIQEVKKDVPEMCTEPTAAQLHPK